MSTIKKPVLPRLLFKWQWVVIPLLIAAAVESMLRRNDLTAPAGYARAAAIASRKKVDFAFIGSSKVAAAFVEKTFDRTMARYLKKRIVSLNLGQGWSSPQLHYLGLRNLVQKYPGSFKKVTLFIEAFAGIPLYQYHHGWKSRWINQQPHLFVPLLRLPDLMLFWKTRNTTTKEKLYITIEYLMSKSHIIRFRERTRQKFEINGQKICTGIMRLLLRQPPPAPEPEPTIQPIGGIKTRPEELERIRKFGLNYYKSLSSQRPILDRWEQSVLADIIALIKQQGGGVVFVNLPAYSVELDAYRTPAHEANKAIIKKQLIKWGATMLTPDFIYVDDDIPDYFHLRFSRAAEFTKKLAQTYLAMGYNRMSKKLAMIKNGKLEI